MTPRQGKRFRTSEVGDLVVTQRHAAGIDVHAAMHFVAVPVADVPAGFVNPDAKLPAGVRKFGANTADLEAIAAWLKACGITTVAMESTGVYWIPLYELLVSRGFDVILVDPRQTKHAPGRPKSDVLDCQWIRRLHSYGLLSTCSRWSKALQLYEFYQQQLGACEKRIEACLRGFADKSGGAKLPPKKGQQKPRRNEPQFGVRALLFRMAGVDLTVIEGISETTALVILSEIGLDLSGFPTEKNFVSWLGLCPQHRGSAGHIFSRRVRRGANRAARALRMAAQGCHHAKNALGAFYRRIQARCGGAKAVVATARKIAERVYRLLKYGQEYVRQGEQAYEEAYRQRTLKGLAHKAESLGYKLVPVAP